MELNAIDGWMCFLKPLIQIGIRVVSFQYIPNNSKKGTKCLIVLRYNTQPGEILPSWSITPLRMK